MELLHEIRELRLELNRANAVSDPSEEELEERFRHMAKAEATATTEIKPAKVEWKPTRTRADDYKPFGAKNIRMSASGKEHFQVTGDILNPYDKELESVSVVVLLRDAEGKLVGGDTAYVQGLEANGSRPFEVKFIQAKDKPTSQEITVYPHGSTSWNSLAAPKQ